ncbi:long-chain fatty acid--CoA ligase [Salarchaeum japonicum]|uniref:Long-chain fatty acid--CoA ligase n=1 Tax=Salarchaeum japonicum TaxID=555573 RepID=A0AAV3T252_9EURY|nr:long-chain fatty acid--CoA ligase [Salarchaeum japonicum]
MSTELTLRPFFWRATRLFPEKRIVSRTHDGRFEYTYGEFGDRVRGLAGALTELGVEQGDRVGTLGWNHHRHFEAYYAAPLLGAQLHTVNLLLHDDHLEHIVTDAADDVLLVDPDAFEAVERLHDSFESVRHIVVMDDEVPETDLANVHAYESLVADADPVESWPDVPEDQPAGMCYTSGTTGKPKGVEYTQKMIYSHAMMTMTPAALDIAEDDVVMPVVPMFHVNSWEFPYAVTMAGARQVYPGPSPDPADLVSLIEDEGVTLTAGVPTVWINVLDYLDDHGGDLSSLERIVVGGSAAPKGVMERYEEEYDVAIEHAWGMTETMSIGSVSRPKSTMDVSQSEEYDLRATQGLLSPGLEMKVVNDDGEEVPWDGQTPGELLVRGPTVVDEYYNRPEANEEDFQDVPGSAATGSTEDGSSERWLKTGDIVVVDEDGYLEIVDRAKDVIKSGGEWISSIELENQLMSHEDVVEAAVISVPHETWQERPLACVVRRNGSDIGVEELRAFLDSEFPSWWLPDDVVFVDEVPKTATGKFDKKVLRDRFDDPDLPYTPGE